MRADLRYAVRSYVRAPGLAATLVLTIALGAGVNAALFGFIGGLLSVDLSGADVRLVDRFDRVAVLLAGASALVFALAGTTVANLLLSRARARAPEMATRVALGAGDAALFRLCLTDVALVATAGGAAGALVGWWTVFLFPLLFWAPDAESLVLSPRLSWVAVSSAVWLAVLLLAGTFPAFAEARRAPNRVLRRESAGTSATAVRRQQRVVAGQVAIACLLLIVASAIGQDLRSTLRSVRGEALGSMLIVPVTASPLPTTADGLAAYIAAIEESIHEVPGLSGWAFTTSLPGGWPNTATFAVEPVAARTREVTFDVATYDIKAMDPATATPIAGRHFGFEDGLFGRRVAVINDVAAARYFEGDATGRMLEARGGTPVEIVGVVSAGGDEGAARPELFYYAEQVRLPAPVADEPFHVAPGGRRPRLQLNRIAVTETYVPLFDESVAAGRSLAVDDREGAPRVALISDDVPLAGDAVGAALISEDGRRFEVVGVLRTEPLAAAQRQPPPSVTLALRQAPSSTVYLTVRTSEPPVRARAALDRAVAQAAGGRPLAAAITLEEHLVRTSLAGERIASALLGVAAAVAIAIAVVGVSGALADLVTRRRRELAVRLALGAGRGRIIGGVAAAGVRMATAGLLSAALVAAIVLPLLGQVIASPRVPDAVTALVTVAATLGLVTLASAVPAWRVTRIKPREALG